MKHAIKILFFCGALLLLPAAMLVQKPQAYSYYENRTLAEFPAFDMGQVLDGSYFPQVEAYISDHFPQRTRLIRWNIRKDLALHSPVVGETVVTEDVLLPYYGSQVDQDADAMACELDMLDRLNRCCQERGILFLYVGLPEQSSAFRDQYPPYLKDSGFRDTALTDRFGDSLAARGIDFLDMAPYLLADRARFYSTTDHHYNLYGAYETYLRVMEAVNAHGCTASVTEDLTITPVDTAFLGSRNRQLYGLFQTDDPLYTAVLAEPIPFTREDNGVPVEPTVYSEADREVYAYYMGGDIAETIIRTDRPALPDVLVVGDSFTNALETILYTSFDEMRSLDFRYYTEKSIYEYLESYQPDVLLYVRDDLSYLETDGNGDLDGSAVR